MIYVCQDPLKFYKEGINFLLEENYQEALNFFDKAIYENPKNDLAYFNRAITLEKIGEHKDALKNYDHEKRIDDNFNDAYSQIPESFCKINMLYFNEK